MLKEEFICPNCDEQYVLVNKNQNKALYCPYCCDPIEQDERGELEMGEYDE